VVDEGDVGVPCSQSDGEVVVAVAVTGVVAPRCRSAAANMPAICTTAGIGMRQFLLLHIAA
jgi:acyl CoA:acetate/3-ketoacid CoA transferase alpha subunit